MYSIHAPLNHFSFDNAEINKTKTKQNECSRRFSYYITTDGKTVNLVYDKVGTKLSSEQVDGLHPIKLKMGQTSDIFYSNYNCG